MNFLYFTLSYNIYRKNPPQRIFLSTGKSKFSTSQQRNENGTFSKNIICEMHDAKLLFMNKKYKYFPTLKNFLHKNQMLYASDLQNVCL